MIELKPGNGWIAFDRDGIRYPWYVSGVLELLEKMDLKGKKLFEWGVGYSTHWYRSRGMKTWGVDSVEKWAKDIITAYEPDKRKYIKFPKLYCDFQYDIVVIDGIYRDECLKVALEVVKPDGLIIIDNFEQPSVYGEWPLTRAILKEQGLVYEIFKQEGHNDWQTIVIYV